MYTALPSLINDLLKKICLFIVLLPAFVIVSVAFLFARFGRSVTLCIDAGVLSAVSNASSGDQNGDYMI